MTDFYLSSDLQNAIDEAAVALLDDKRARYHARVLQEGLLLPMVDDVEALNAEIYDIIEKYGADNGLPEGWWMEEIEYDDLADALCCDLHLTDTKQ